MLSSYGVNARHFSLWSPWTLPVEEVPEDHDFQHSSWVFLFSFSLCFPGVIYSIALLFFLSNSFQGCTSCLFSARIEVFIYWYVWVYRLTLDDCQTVITQYHRWLTFSNCQIRIAIACLCSQRKETNGGGNSCFSSAKHSSSGAMIAVNHI